MTVADISVAVPTITQPLSTGFRRDMILSDTDHADVMGRYLYGSPMAAVSYRPPQRGDRH